MTSEPEIAHGIDTDLGARAVEHLDFIVRRVRDVLRAETCTHSAARAFCPDCGKRAD